MKYSLSEFDGANRQSFEASDNFAAERWALSWVKSHAKGRRYSLEREDGQYGLTVFQTDFGQWYVTPKEVGAEH